MNEVISVIIAVIAAVLKASPALTAEDTGKLKLAALEAIDNASEHLTDAEKAEWEIVRGAP